MFNHPLIWFFALVFVLLGALLFRLLQWNKRLKAALKKRLNTYASPQSALVLEPSQKSINSNTLIFYVILGIVLSASVFINFFYEKNEDILIGIFELIIASAGLFAGFLLGSSRSRVEADHYLKQLIKQYNQRKRVERKISLSEDRLENQQLALATLTQNQLHDWHDPSEVFREMAMISAQTLNVERVGVWLLNADKTQLNCSDLYLKSVHLHSATEPLIKQELPIYFNALENNRLLIANDVTQAEATSELVSDYMRAHNIGATLESTIWLNDQFIGVICHEHVGGARTWTLDEQNYASAIASLASLTIETHRRHQAEQALKEHSGKLEQTVQARTQLLHESDKRFSYVVQNAPIAILLIDRKGKIADLNAEAQSATGYSREELLGKHFIRLVVAKESRHKAVVVAARTLVGENFRNVELMLQNAKGEKYEYECSIGMSAKSVNDGSGLMVAIAQNISQQKMLEKSLITARQSAEAADRTKSMFVASMSHELRTPLNSIIGFLGVVLQGISGDLNPLQKGQLDRAYQSSKHLLLLISDVLEVSKIEAGFLQVNSEKFELKPLLAEVEHAVQHLATGKKLAISIDCTAKLMLETDRGRLYQVLLNVLSNAVKYTEQGSVKVKARLENKQLTISCKDTGIGIDEASFTKLFQPFERVESHLTIKTPGTGLGLYLTHKILTQLLGGNIVVSSKLGQGSTFTIIMPMDNVTTTVQKTVSSKDNKIEEPVS